MTDKCQDCGVSLDVPADLRVVDGSLAWLRRRCVACEDKLMPITLRMGRTAEPVHVEFEVTAYAGTSYDHDTRTLIRSNAFRRDDGHVEARREVVTDVDPEDL